jgi:hypothetical protein
VEAAPEITPQPAEEVFDKDRAMDTIHKLREVEKQAKKEKQELEQLRADKAKRDEAEMTEAQRLQKQKADVEAENARLKADLLRREVIAEVNLPSTLADRLQGTTKEELLADAKKLAELLPKTKQAPTLNATNPPNGQGAETDAQKRERLFGKPLDIFDKETIERAGGGVVWKSPPTT